MGVEADRVDADFMHVGFAQHQRSRPHQPGDDGAVLRGRLLQKRRPQRGGKTGHVEFVFHHHRHAFEHAARVALLEPLGRGGSGLRQRFRLSGDEKAHARAALVEGADVLLELGHHC